MALGAHSEVDLKFLKRIRYNKIDPYIDYKVRKNRFGKFRAISSPIPPLKALQSNLLTEIYAIPCAASAHAYIPKRSVITAASAHLGMTWGIRLDIEDFFHHVTHHRIIAALTKGKEPNTAKVWAHIATRSPVDSRGRIPTKYNRRFNFWDSRKWRLAIKSPYILFGFPTSRVAETAAKVLSHPQKRRRFLPQGAPTSGYLANLVFKDLDERIERHVNRLGFKYTRYSDDILISTDKVDFDRELAAQVVHWIGDKLAFEGFTLNRAKTRIMTPGSRKSYLGLIISGNELRLPKEVRERISGELRDVKKFGLESQSERFHNGLTRIRRHPGKNPIHGDGYWTVLQGLLCWVEVADAKLFEKLRIQYALTTSQLSSLDDSSASLDSKALSELFDRRTPKFMPQMQSAPSLIFDLDLDDF